MRGSTARDCGRYCPRYDRRMRYRLEAQVDGLLKLENKDSVLSASRGDALYELRSDATGNLTLSVTLPVPDGLNLDVNLRIHKWLDGRQIRSSAQFNHYPQLVNTARRHLQELESALAFYPRDWPLRRIRWDVTRLTYLNDSADGQRDLTIEIRPTFYRHTVTVTAEDFGRAAKFGDSYPELVVPLAFWREGVNGFERGDHLQAFYCLYFVVEGLFANGRSGEKEVIKAFRDSEVLRTACDQELVDLKTNDSATAELLSTAILSVGGENFDAEGLQRFLIRTRGELHHFFQRSTRATAHPFKQADLSWIVSMMIGLATRIILLEGGRIDAAPA